MRRGGRLAVLTALAGLWLLASGPAAAAHGMLRSSDPAGGASLERPPAAVTLRFTESPDPGLSSVRVLDAGGRVVAGGRTRPVAGRPAELRVPLTGLPAGSYTVAWRVVSSVDGHRTDGVFAFGVGAAGAGPLAAQAVAEVRAATAPTPLAVAGRWAFYWGLVLLVGAAATGLLVFGRRLPGRPGLLLGVALVAAAAGLAAMAAAARADAGVPLGDLLGSTTGRWLVWRAAMLAGAGAASWWLLARPGRTGPLLALGLAAGGGMLVHALASHAAGPSPLRAANLLAQWAHLLGVGTWIGGLAWLLPSLHPHLGGGGSTREVVVRFSKLAGISLGVVVATGVARAAEELGGWGRLVDSWFGLALDLKLLLFAGLLALGAVNRYRVVPRFRAGGQRAASTRLRRNVGAELGIAGSVLLATALLSQLAPGTPASAARPRPAAQAGLQATGTDWSTTLKLTLSITPGAPGPNRFVATVADFDTGAAVPVDRVALAGSPAGRQDLAAARLELVKGPDGHWLGSGRLLSMAGPWNLTTIIQRPAGGTVVPLEVTVPAPRMPDQPDSSPMQEG